MTEEICTEIVYRFDFPNPPTLLQLWRDYIHERARRLGQEIPVLLAEDLRATANLRAA